MARILTATMPIPGHFAPMLPVVSKLIARGHEVVWYGSKFYRDRIEAAGAHFVPITGSIDHGKGDLNEFFPERRNKKGINQIVYDFVHVFIKPIEGMTRDLNAILKDFPADAIVADVGMAAATIMGVNRIKPVATLGITTLGIPDPDVPPNGLGLLPDLSLKGHIRDRIMTFVGATMVFRPVQKELDIVLARMNLPPYKFAVTGSPYLYLQPTIPEFEYKRRSLPSHLHYIGALLPDPPANAALPAWWDEVSATTKPIVLVTQGTIATNPQELLMPTLKALANEDVIVIGTTGSKTAAELGIDVPKNARVEPFIPFAPLMPYISAYVTNGGFGGVMFALSHGVPIVAGGITEDKPEVNNRVQYSGVGINLKTAAPTPEQVGEAVRRILREPSYRQHAERMRQALRQYDAPTMAAERIERLAETGQAVLR